MGNEMEFETIGYVLAAIVIIAVVVLYLRWYMYQQVEHYSGVVASYYCTHDFLGYLNCEVVWQGSSGDNNLNWSSWSFLPLNYVGNDIGAQPGQTCSIWFKGEFMQNYTFR